MRHVDLRVERRPTDHLLIADILPEHLRVHQHPPFARPVEPPHIQHRFRLARPEVVPLPVGPRFDPRMVVVRMRPPRRIDLSRRNPNRPQRSHRKGRLLAAPTLRIPNRSRRRHRPAVARRIDHLLVTPVVHLQNSLLHRQTPHPILQLVVKHRPRRIQILVVDPNRQHIVQKQLVRHRPAPRHLIGRPERSANIAQIELRPIIRHIPNRHISIQKLHPGPLLLRQPGRKLRQPARTLLQTRRHTPTGLRILDKLATPARNHQHTQNPIQYPSFHLSFYFVFEKQSFNNRTFSKEKVPKRLSDSIRYALGSAILRVVGGAFSAGA